MIAFNDTDLDIMARTVWGEARGEPDIGKIAVAWVIRNRLNRPHRFRPTIAGICQQPYQFSCWLSGDPNRNKMLAVGETDPVFAKCKEISLGVLNDEIPDPTGGAEFYYASGIPVPAWAIGHEPTVVIGHHRFFAGIA